MAIWWGVCEFYDLVASFESLRIASISHNDLVLVLVWQWGHCIGAKDLMDVQVLRNFGDIKFDQKDIVFLISKLENIFTILITISPGSISVAIGQELAHIKGILLNKGAIWKIISCNSAFGPPRYRVKKGLVLDKTNVWAIKLSNYLISLQIKHRCELGKVFISGLQVNIIIFGVDLQICGKSVL